MTDSANQNQVTEERAKQILGSRSIVNQEGKYRAKVTNTTFFTRPDGQNVVITNYNLMTAYHKKQAIELIKEGKLQEALNQRLSSSQRVSDEGEPIDYIPAKGEFVDVVVETVTTSNDVTGLFIVSVVPVPLSKSTPAKADDFFNPTDENLSAEAVEATEEKVEAATVLNN